MVSDAIYRDWFAKFGIPVQIHTDGGKEFINKLSAELFRLLNVRHTKTSLAHPQCNAQVEAFNKTVKKFLQPIGTYFTYISWYNTACYKHSSSGTPPALLQVPASPPDTGSSNSTSSSTPHSSPIPQPQEQGRSRPNQRQSVTNSQTPTEHQLRVLHLLPVPQRITT